MRLLHIVNPVKVGKTSDLYQAQPITFETMRSAKEFAADEVAVNLVTTQYPEDHSIIPEFFTKTKDLDRSLLDFGTFDKPKKLPVLKDIFKRATDQDPAADYIIYTNVDIALYPSFYSTIAAYIKSGYDAICINRNTIIPENEDYTLSELYGLKGSNHEGIDCFVVKKTLIPHLKFNNAVIGTGPVGLILISNLMHFAEKFIWLRNANLTFHIGDDKNWLHEKVSERSMLYYNYNQLKIVLEELISKEVSYVKMDVLISILEHAKYFLDHLKFLDKPVHREKLMFYSDHQYDELLKMEHGALNAMVFDNNVSFSKKPFFRKKQGPHIFLHVHKCGGTSLMNCLDANYKKDNIFVINGSNYRESYAAFKNLDSKKRKSLDLLRGHHFYGSHEYLRDSAKYFTMLREPISRLISLYNYLREIDLYKDINKNEMDLAEFLESGLAMAADNGMTRLLTNNDFDKLPNGMVNETHALQAIENLEKHFVAVGLTENFEESLTLFKNKLGWKVLPDLKMDNKTNNKILEKTEAESFFNNNESFSRYINADVMVYRYAKKRFLKEVKNL